MGVTPEQKLVIKHTFLEYVCDQVPSNCKPARQRALTEPAIAEDPCYGEVRERFHGSDSSGSDDAVHTERMPDTPEASPLHSFAQSESWQACIPEPTVYAETQAWSEQWSESYGNGDWWSSEPYEVSAELSMGYCTAINQDPSWEQKFSSPSQWSVSDRFGHGAMVGLPRIPENDLPSPSNAVEPSASNSALECDSTNGAKETRTTVMLRGLPETYTRTELLQLLGAEGFFGRFNFMYLPVDFKRHKNLGYALINLVSPAEALRIGSHFEGFSNWARSGGEVCSVAWCSPQQGLDAHVDRYRNSPVMHESMPDEWRPMLLRHGVQIAFPPPTTKIKAPRLKGNQ